MFSNVNNHLDKEQWEGAPYLSDLRSLDSAANLSKIDMNLIDPALKKELELLREKIGKGFNFSTNPDHDAVFECIAGISLFEIPIKDHERLLEQKVESYMSHLNSQVQER